jgi:hypothetical protein
MVTNCDKKSFGSRIAEKIIKVAETTGTVDVRYNFVESFHTSKSSWMMDPTHSREMASSSVIGLVEIRRSSK